MMSHKERLLAPFGGQKPDRPAWVADLSYWYDGQQKAGTLDPVYAGADGLLRLHADLGVSCYYSHWVMLYEAQYDRVAVETEERDGVRKRRWRAPAGELVETLTYLPESFCWAHTEYPVKKTADLAIVRDIAERTRYQACPSSRFSDMERRLGEAGVPLVPIPRSPLPALLTDWCGVETGAFLLMDEPAAAAAAMRSITAANESAFAALAAGPAFLLHFCDNLDSRTSTPFFEDYMQEYYEQRLAQLHAAGKVAVVHLDGGVRGLLGKLAACGFDAIEAVTPAPVGDVRIDELRELVGNARTVIWGGIPGVMFCPPWTDDNIRCQTQQVLDHLAGEGRLVVGSADQVPPDGNIAFCRSIAQTIESFRKAASS